VSLNRPLAASGGVDLSDARAVLFDVDGTLLESSEFVYAGFTHALGHYGYRVPERAALPDLTSGTLEEVYARLTLGDGDVPALIEAHRSFQEQHLSLCSIFPETPTVLAALAQRGYRMAAITSRSRRTSLRTLEVTGILPYFPVVISWEDVEQPKPHPEPVLRALSLLALHPRQAVMVGDTWADVEAGRSAGVRTVGVTYGPNGQRVAESAPDVLIASLDELLSYLKPHDD